MRPGEEAASTEGHDSGTALASGVGSEQDLPAHCRLDSQAKSEPHLLDALLRDYMAGSPLRANSGDWACESMYSRSDSSSSRDAVSLPGVPAKEARVDSVGVTPPRSGEVDALENEVFPTRTGSSGDSAAGGAGGGGVRRVGDGRRRCETHTAVPQGEASPDNSTLSSGKQSRCAWTATERSIANAALQAQRSESGLPNELSQTNKLGENGEAHGERDKLLQCGLGDAEASGNGTLVQTEDMWGKAGASRHRPASSGRVPSSLGAQPEGGEGRETGEGDASQSPTAGGRLDISQCHGGRSPLNGGMPDVPNVARYPSFAVEAAQPEGGEVRSVPLQPSAVQSDDSSPVDSSPPSHRSGERVSPCWSRVPSARDSGNAAVFSCEDMLDGFQLYPGLRCGHTPGNREARAASLGDPPTSLNATLSEDKPRWQVGETSGGRAPAFGFGGDSSPATLDGKLGLVQAAVLLWEERLRQQQRQQSAAGVRLPERKGDDAVSLTLKPTEEAESGEPTARVCHRTDAGGGDINLPARLRDAAVSTDDMFETARRQLPPPAGSGTAASQRSWIEQVNRGAVCLSPSLWTSRKACSRTRSNAVSGCSRNPRGGWNVVVQLPLRSG